MPARPNIAIQYNQINNASPEQKKRRQQHAIANLGEASFQLPKTSTFSPAFNHQMFQIIAMNLEEILSPHFPPPISKVRPIQ
jgi:hypothetical protein